MRVIAIMSSKLEYCLFGLRAEENSVLIDPQDSKAAVQSAIGSDFSSRYTIYAIRGYADVCS